MEEDVPPPPSSPKPDQAPFSPRPKPLLLQSHSSPKRFSSISPPAKRTPLRLKWAASEIEPTLARANELLASKDIFGAIDLYTDVLKDAVGHPVAFLNRSLCYLVLEQPSLAAFDAYRAYTGVLWSKDAVSGMGRKIQNWLISYASLSSVALLRGKEWAAEPTCKLGLPTTLLGQNLASLQLTRRNKLRRTKDSSGIVLEPLPAPLFGPPLPDSDKNSPKRFKTVRPDGSVVEDALMKSLYRLALALWKCGGGAIRSALDIIAIARDKIDSDDDRLQFDMLERHIWSFIEQCQQDEKMVGPPASALGIRDILSSRYTHVTREVYRWDKYTLTTSNMPHNLESINNSANVNAPLCSVKAKLRHGRTPSLHLHAVKDVEDQSQIFREQSCFHVSSGLNGREFFFCDVCASALKIPDEAFTVADKQAAELMELIKRQEESCEAFGNRGRPPVVFEDADAKIDDREARESGKYMTPPTSDDIREAAYPSKYIRNGLNESENDQLLFATSHRGESAMSRAACQQPFEATANRTNRENMADIVLPEGFQTCPMCRDVAFCSKTCHEGAASSYHVAICRSGLDDLTRTLVLPQPEQYGPYPADKSVESIETTKCRYGVPTPQFQKLTLHMLMRAMAFCFSADESDGPLIPLAQDWCRMLDGDLKEPSLDPALMSERWDGSWSDSTALIECFSNSNGETDAMPWSFDNNIVRLLLYLFTLSEAVNGAGATAMMDVERYDGWMLNTLAAKIQRNMRVTRYARALKRFGPESQVKTQSYGKFEDYDLVGRGFKEDGEDPEKRDDEEIWVGSLHPLSQLVRVVDDEEGRCSNRTVNVNFWEGDGAVECTTVAPPIGIVEAEHADADGACFPRTFVIRAGDELVRTREVLYPANDERKDKIFGKPEDNGDGDCDRGGGRNHGQHFSIRRYSNLLKRTDTESDEEMDLDAAGADTMLAASETRFSEQVDPNEDIEMEVQESESSQRHIGNDDGLMDGIDDEEVMRDVGWDGQTI